MIKITALLTTLKAKLIGSFICFVCVFILVSLYNMRQMNQIHQQLAYQNDKVALKQTALELKQLIQELNVISSGLMISKETKYINLYNKKKLELQKDLKIVTETADTDDQRKWRSRLIVASSDYMSSFDTAASLVQSGTQKQIELENNLKYFYDLAQQQKSQMFEFIDLFYQVFDQDAAAAVRRSNEQIQSTNRIMAGVSFAVLISIAFLLYYLIRTFVRPIRRLNEAVKAVAEGDLRNKIGSEAKDELGQLSRRFDEMTARFGRTLSRTQKVAAALAGQSGSFRSFAQSTAASNGHILKAIGEISIGAEQQASHSEQSTLLISELEQAVESISSFTHMMRETRDEAVRNTRDGASAILTLKSASAAADELIGKVVNAYEALAEHSRSIETITRAITELSSQTNVLALNAAIEASRAGLHGKGFAVIANEVRQLSDESKTSAKHISVIASELLEQMTQVKEQMLLARKSLSEQSREVAHTETAFQTIECSMMHIAEQTEQVHASVDEAKRQNEKLIAAAQLIAAIAEETAAGVEDVKASSTEQHASVQQIAEWSQQIHGYSEQLFEEIRHFQIDGKQ